MQSNNNGLGVSVGDALARSLGGVVVETPKPAITVNGKELVRDQNFNNQPRQEKKPEVGRPVFTRDAGYQYKGQRPQQQAPEVFGTVDLSKTDTILVKFSFFEDTDYDLYPDGIKVTPWVDKKKLLGDAYVDHGVQPIVARAIGLGLIRRGITNQGFYLHDVFVYDKTERHPNLRNYNRKKYAVTLEFRRGDQASMKLDRKMLDHLRHLADIRWQECFVWDNTGKKVPPGEKPDLSVTVNCRNPLRDCHKPRALAIRDGDMQVVDMETDDEKA